MSYKINPGEPLDSEIRRIADEQIESAIRSLRDPGEDPHEAIHDARKRLKKLRGLIRLVRTGDEAAYAALNARFRDTARELSGVRDKAALVEMIDKLQGTFDEDIATDAFEPVRARLVADRDEAMATDDSESGETIASAIASLEDARPTLADLRFGKRSRKSRRDARIAAAGFARTFDRAREGLNASRRTRDAEDFHELRKRIKYHWMHLRLLSPLWPDGLSPSVDLAKRIAEDLGDDHDVAVFRAELASDPTAYGTAKQLSIVLALADRYQTQLREKSLDGARVLLAEKGDAVEARIMTLYRLGAERACRVEALPVQAPEAEGRSA